MNRFYTIIVLLFVSIPFFAQGNFPKELTNLSSAKKYFSEHILDLDPIEGIYDFENVVQASSGRYVGSRKQHCTIVILDLKKVKSKIVSDKFVYTAYSVSGDIDGFVGGINTISKGSYYTFSRFNEKGDLLTFRFELENNISFKIIDRAYFGDASRHIVTTAIKSYPTVQMYQSAVSAEIEKNATSSGTGFILSQDGYIVTNNHVIENAQNGNIKITGINEDYHTSYKVRVEVTDKQNDLAILKIIGSSPTIKVPYAFKFTTASVGEDCFVLGYPLISSMGKDIKLTNGIISSKTGYDGNIAQYQISAPVQPGNSGGPLFDKNGNVIGIVQAKHTQAENAGYAIKASYIRNLVELLPTPVVFPQTNTLSGKTLPQQVEQASKSVCIIIVNGD